MNMVQACGVVAQQRGESSILVATMGAMFVFDRIEGGDGSAAGVPLMGGKAGLVIGLGVAKLKSLMPRHPTPRSPDGAVAGRSPSRMSSVPLMGGAPGLGRVRGLGAHPGGHVNVLDLLAHRRGDLRLAGDDGTDEPCPGYGVVFEHCVNQ